MTADGERPTREARLGTRIGVDVGNARVGVAASDPSGVLAHPVATLARDVERESDLERIVALVAEREAIEVVVGLPRHLSGEEGEAARSARAYAARLAQRIPAVTVRLVDERLTTVAAHRRLRDSGVPGRGQRAVVDQAAAVIILQSALDAEATSGRAPGETVSPHRKPRKKERRR
ncbi:Holliday junction resolvase [Intrasporangium oryzae NRRL B-24470]|uniref:Putative pre-16S rRNA nuclease n=1 Tax=Intrasporangium oryzae NRRL B-24470 TaxID=1386089 RepID=W9G9S9_9MICO|nr:Holliday junction resolvase RuvX [Intrasporangium oryzae]EWT02956.1 Holliday junction resolvase [Intrasporangium oryzae NRRL B-24470]